MADDRDLTGNEYVSLPGIARDASITSVNVVHGGHTGLVEWAGPDALFRLNISFGGMPADMSTSVWRRLDRWIPIFVVTFRDGSTVTGTLCAPGGYPSTRGFVIRLEADNRSNDLHDLRVELDITWQWSRLRVASARPFGVYNRMTVDDSGHMLLLETDGGQGPALAIAGSGDTQLSMPLNNAGTHPGSDSALEGLGPGRVLSAANGDLLRARVTQTRTIRAGGHGTIAYNIGAGRERDTALVSANALGRHDADHWVREARFELSHILRPAQDHRWADLLNRNLIFNRYYAVGRGIDDDRLYLMRSRSPDCAAPAVFNEREALFWTVPALAMLDSGIAREALFRVLELASERAGEFTRCIDGAAYDSAFVLDQVLLYAWAIDHYVEATSDESVLEDPIVRQIMFEIDASAYSRLHTRHMLAATELLPSGDVADYPFTTAANVLIWRFASRMPRLLGQNNPGDPPPRLEGTAPDIEAEIWQHCVSDVKGHPVLASSASLEGDAAVYDDPAFSLALLPFFGFCSVDDPVWRATMEFLRSPGYPLWRTGTIPGIAARSGDPRPRLAALCAELLTHRRDDALERLQRIDFPCGVAAAGYDVSGQSVDQPAHAALGGFLAWSLVHAAEPTDDLAGRRKKRR